MISKKDVKRTFKVFLDSNRTNSFYGSLFNANYYVDLTHIIFEDGDFDKSYYMNVSYVSKYSTNFSTDGLLNNVYTLHIDMGKGLNIFQYNQQKNPSTIVPIDVLNLATAVGGFNLNDSMSKPVFLQNIRNITTINLNLIDTTTNTTFSPTTDTDYQYICVLTFIEA